MEDLGVEEREDLNFQTWICTQKQTARNLRTSQVIIGTTTTINIDQSIKFFPSYQTIAKIHIVTRHWLSPVVPVATFALREQRGWEWWGGGPSIGDWELPVCLLLSSPLSSITGWRCCRWNACACECCINRNFCFKWGFFFFCSGWKSSYKPAACGLSETYRPDIIWLCVW